MIPYSRRGRRPVDSWSDVYNYVMTAVGGAASTAVAMLMRNHFSFQRLWRQQLQTQQKIDEYARATDRQSALLTGVVDKLNEHQERIAVLEDRDERRA